MKNNLNIEKQLDRPRLQSEELYIELKQGKRFGFIFSIKVICITMMIYIIWWWKLNVKNYPNKGCFSDPIHQLLDPLNNIVNTNSAIAVSLQVSSSLVMDAAFFGTLFYWVLHGTSFKLIVATFSFYTFRFFNQQMFKMEYPQGFFWDDPGVPSLVVPYGFTSDFFFSGHCGFLTLVYLYWREKGFQNISRMILFTLCYQILVLETFRNHYSIDISTGIAVANWLYYWISEYEDVINFKVKKFICKINNISEQ